MRLLATLGLLAGGLAAGNAALVSGAPPAGAATPPPSCASGTCTVTFPKTGAAASWTVPDGVSALSVTLYGADGGAGDATDLGSGGGGSGAEVKASVAVSAGTALTVNVGGTVGFNAGGYNGGGVGNEDSGGGGGATDLSAGATSLLVAGGGGGGGLFGSNDSGGLVNGGGGGTAGGAGSAGTSMSIDGATLGGGGGGGAGTGAAGGSGGPGGAVSGTSSCSGGAFSLAPGNSGSAGAGGGGHPDAGGGGGGGYYGGGQGGGPAADDCGDLAGWGGGGGGSSYTAGPGVSGASVDDTPTLQASALSGNGEAVLSYTDPVATGAPSYEALSGQVLTVGAASGLLSSAAGTAGPTGDILAVSVPSTTTAQGGTVVLDANGDGGFTYTPPASFTGTDTFTYTVTDTSDGAGDYATGTASVEVLAPVQVSTTTLPEAQYASSYDQALAATGGTAPYTWAVSSGSLPPGLGLSSSGVLSGTPTAAGAFSFSVEATDSTTPTALNATQALSLTVAPAPLSITASSPAMTYGGAVPAITPTYSGFVNGDTAASLSTAPSCSTTATSTSPAGNYPSTCTGAVGPNYHITYVAGTVTVNAAPLSITASSPAMAYGGTVPAITPIYSGLVAGDTAASLSTAPTCSTTATSSSPPGSYPSSCSGAVDSNYSISYATGSVSVGTDLLTITATSATMTYGGAAPVIMPVYGGFANGDTAASLSTAPSCSTTATSSSPPGTYSASCTGAVDANYAIGYAAGMVTVAPASLTVTASSLSLTYGEAVPAITPSYSGFVNGDSAASLTRVPTCSTTATSSSPPGTYPATCTGAVDANYAISYVAGTVTVAAPPPTSPVPALTTTTTTAAARSFPDADVSYPNGTIVVFGTSDYVFAGGRAFAAAGSSLAAVEKVDHTKVLAAPAGAAPPTAAAPRPGTLLSTKAVNEDGTIFVAGTDGELHGFSTPRQFFTDGYDAALVVTVPSVAGLKVGATDGVAGASVTALATRADGAIVDSAGTFFVFSGGRAFGISSPAGLSRVQRSDSAVVLTGPVGPAQTGTTIASGALLSAPGKVYVSYQGDLYLFKTMAQLVDDGYGGTAAVPVAGTGGVSVVSSYSGP